MTPALRKAFELHQPGIGGGATLLSSYGEEAFEVQRRKNQLRESLTTEDWPKKVLAFMTLFGQKIAAGDSLGKLDAETQELEILINKEEDRELYEAAERNDLVEVVDALFDGIYTRLHWLLALGLTPAQINLGMDEVHASNMTKTDDEGNPIINDGVLDPSKPIGKVLKGRNYVPVNLRTLLHEWGFPVPFSMECAD